MESESRGQSPPTVDGEGGRIFAIYEVGMLVLSIYVLLALLCDVFMTLEPEMSRLLSMLDVGVCAVFFGDFLVRLSLAESKWGYFVRWGWVDLVSSIPIIESLRIARLARILRIIRILRAFKSTKRLIEFAFKNRMQSAVQSSVVVSVLMLVFSSIAVLNAEAIEGANIKTAEDAIWWSWVTITTVGYGDKFPITTEGRILGAFVMFVGVTLFGTLTAWVAARFVSENDAAKDSLAEAELHNEVRALRIEIASLREHLKGSESDVAPVLDPE